jgi:hypothetical protein
MLTEKHVVLTDERLDGLAGRFILGRIRPLLGIAFGDYVRDPEHYDSLAVIVAAIGRARAAKVGSLDRKVLDLAMGIYDATRIIDHYRCRHAL